MIKPVNGYVLCKKATMEQKTQSGIVIAGVRPKGYDGHLQAEILDISHIEPIDTDTPPEPEEFKIGDRVLFKKGQSEKIEIEFDDKTEYYLIKKDDIMGIL